MRKRSERLQSTRINKEAEQVREERSDRCSELWQKTPNFDMTVGTNKRSEAKRGVAAEVHHSYSVVVLL
jgi:hypothetical protein